MSEEEQRKTGEGAALRRFPAERRTIQQLLVGDGDFYDMCEELAEAESALLAAEALPLDVREARIAEWTASIDRLVGEIARALREANVIRIGWAGDLKSRR
ncbi:hypothetical protein JJB09_18335 [Rhizobium sp. KVB221]|uniref:Uncharacterized protein n=1 Tax=Rhizobium setariae TaxID=2801340 RepID=A0A937CM77_9HYPH|nr:hypothetical protein [Rhizobium setariae]MBL0373985.1 hypothetical protein [Rhizobium setariae]